MELQTIRQVLSDFGISRRTLCYYEEIGLLKSSRKDDYAYRVYEESEIKRLQQIILLRKLQIPMKQIKDILNNQNAVEVIEIFNQNISELDEKITALSAIRSILTRFVEELQEKADVHLKLDLLNDKTMLAVVNALAFSENKVKEKVSMDELNQASEMLSKLAEKKDNESIGPVETPIKTDSPKLENFEIIKCQSYRFIGKAVYVRNDWGNQHAHTGEIVQSVWLAKDWIFKTLDEMTGYIANDMPYAGGIYMWDRYEERYPLQGYIIGKFMKADTPVPDGMDYFDIPEGFVAKGWGGYVEGEVKDILRNSEEYADASWFWGGEVFNNFESLGNGINVDNLSGYFISCTKK